MDEDELDFMKIVRLADAVDQMPGIRYQDAGPASEGGYWELIFELEPEEDYRESIVFLIEIAQSYRWQGRAPYLVISPEDSTVSATFSVPRGCTLSPAELAEHIEQRFNCKRRHKHGWFTPLPESAIPNDVDSYGAVGWPDVPLIVIKKSPPLKEIFSDRVE